MRSKSFTVTASAGGTTYSPAYVVDLYNNPTDIGVGVTIIGTGSAVYTVQHTFSDPFAINLNASPTAGIWLDNDFLAGSTANDDTNYTAAPRAIRLALNAAASASAVITINQAGPE